MNGPEEILRETIGRGPVESAMHPAGRNGAFRLICQKQDIVVSKPSILPRGGTGTDPREESLFDRVREEYGRYFTPGGGEKKGITEGPGQLRRTPGVKLKNWR